jgi:hypothetical protein
VVGVAGDGDERVDALLREEAAHAVARDGVVGLADLGLDDDDAAPVGGGRREG